MDRRTFLATVAGGLLAAPLAAEAEQAAEVARIGYLAGNLTPNRHLAEAFRQALHDLGYVEGRNLVIEYRDAEGKFERKLVSGPGREWRPQVRLWRGRSWVQWIQYARKDWPEGPHFYLAKPAVLALEESRLLAGLYVERGYDSPTGSPNGPLNQELLLAPGWQWHGVVALWSDPLQRQQFHALVQKLLKPLLVIRAATKDDPFPPPAAQIKSFSVTSPDVYQQALEHAQQTPSQCWLDIAIGIQISEQECLSQQAGVAGSCVAPLQVAAKLQTLVEEATP